MLPNGILAYLMIFNTKSKTNYMNWLCRLLTLISCFCPILGQGMNEVEVGIFGKKLVTPQESITFLVGGHLSGNANNGYPAGTLLASIDSINEINPSLLISLGDLFYNAQKDFPNYNHSFFSKVTFPTFNAVGNHDLSKKGGYDNLYDYTFFSFEINSNLFLILDTERADGTIEGEQLEFFKDALSKQPFKNIFIFSHRPIWVDNNEKFEGLFKGYKESLIGNNFDKTIYPMLERLDIPVYWFAGSTGPAHCSFFWHQKKDNIYYIQSAIRDFLEDGLLIVYIDKSQQVSFSTLSLTKSNLQPLAAYNLSFWRSRNAITQINYRMIPLWTIQAITHRYFWYGGLICTILLLIVKRVIKKLVVSK